MSDGSQSTHEGWLVDLDGTLYDPRWVKLGMALELGLFGWGVVGAVRAFRKAHEEMRQEMIGAMASASPAAEVLEAEAGRSPFDAQLARAARASGVPEDRLRAIVDDWMVSRPCRWLARGRRGALLDEIAAHRAAGGKTALVSDYPATRKLEALGARDLFDVVVSNGEPGGPGRLKPAPDGYLLAARHLGIEPSRCLVIGDRDDADGRAAELAGMAYRRV